MPNAARSSRTSPESTRWLEPSHSTPPVTLADAVRSGLGQREKSLPSHFFYDAEGSRLFEKICDLPEYYLSRAEAEILESAAPDLAARLPNVRTLIELGSGSALKTEKLLTAFLDGRDLCYAPVDVSHSALEESVERIAQRMPSLEILATVSEYEAGLAAIEEMAKQPALILWLGSSIGNLRPDAASNFLARCAANLGPEGRLLVGIDLRKDRVTLENAYNDRQGITARFNLNLLQRINNELDADFQLKNFAHEVHYNEASGSVESFIESRADQHVEIRALDLGVDFSAGERIHTEDSFKYSPEEIETLAARAGLEIEARYLDAEERFSLNLLAPADPLK